MHIRDASRLGKWLYVLLYCVSPSVFLLAIVWTPWTFLLAFVPVLNPARSYQEWRAYRAEWLYYEARDGPEATARWAEKLPALFAGPAYGFMGPVRAARIWLRLRLQLDRV